MTAPREVVEAHAFANRRQAAVLVGGRAPGIDPGRRVFRILVLGLVIATVGLAVIAAVAALGTRSAPRHCAAHGSTVGAGASAPSTRRC